MVEGYCMKCKVKGEMEGAKIISKNGRKMWQGKHKCGTKMVKFGAK
jgi:hypothetical protein